MSMNIHRCRFVDYTPHAITSLAFSKPSTNDFIPHDLRLAVGRSNGDIEIWNPRWSWVHETTLYGGRGRSIEALAWSTWDDGSLRLFSIGGSTCITEWNLKTGMPLVNHDCNAGVIWSLASSPDGTKLAVGCDDGTVVIVDISGGPGVLEHYKILQRQSARVLCLSWIDESQIVGGCSDARLRVWDTSDNGRILGAMKVDRSKTEDTLVWSVIVIGTGRTKQIVSGDSTGSVKIWDAVHQSLRQSFKVHEADVLCLAASADGSTFFSAGVDRKMVCHKIVDAKTRKWANVSNRLLHSHDVRAMATFEAKGTSFLISGGVEKSLVVNSINDFMDGMFRKIPITKQKPCVSVTPEPRLLMMWADQTVKIWQIDTYVEENEETDEYKGKKLVCKITLSSDENITHAELSPNGSYVAISTLSETKVFQLDPTEDGKALRVTKLEIEDLLDVGARVSKFDNDSEVLFVVTPDNEVIACNVLDALRAAEKENDMMADDEETEENNSNLVELDVPVHSSGKSKVANINNISLITISKSNKYLAIATQYGWIDIFDISTPEYPHLKTFSRISSAPPTALNFSPRDSLIVATAEIKILEFDVTTGALSDWTRRNSDLIPREIVSLVDKCCGVFFETSSTDRIWLWGANWLAFVDVGVNIPTERIVKRRIDKLGPALAEEDKVGSAVIITKSATASSTPAAVKKSTTVVDNNTSTVSSDDSSSRYPYWITHKYRPVIFAGSLGNGELIVTERPPFDIPLPPAFWSNHKIRM
ncbi:WD40 repeat-like protein [Nadsonia fulvescens var. elongata DSM 6958]|uniref:WD40 repeat-like protein n=1 Tax=Nadsonia fulvescens var. elongata DSM 6958 TaxID=857566 RepID=A0A1E3PM21_9ASCO|nr:WD40 repeat-like protein [Nadsonia fulvescens var. elongata DSM 6958]